MQLYNRMPRMLARQLGHLVKEHRLLRQLTQGEWMAFVCAAVTGGVLSDEFVVWAEHRALSRRWMPASPTVFFPLMRN
jgi:hypothetical protein